jgi:hypothetical protein
MITNTNEIIVMNFIKLSVWWFQWKMESSEHKIKKLDAPKTKYLPLPTHYPFLQSPLHSNVWHVNTSFYQCSPRGIFISIYKTCSSYLCHKYHACHTCNMFKCLSKTHYTFNQSLCSSSRSLTTIFTFSNFSSKNSTHHHFLPTFPITQKFSSISFPKILFVRMASGEQKFPPQKQDTQPGKEHVMDPLPQFTCPDYNPSNKLQVYISIYMFTFI